MDIRAVASVCLAPMTLHCSWIILEVLYMYMYVNMPTFYQVNCSTRVSNLKKRILTGPCDPGYTCISYGEYA